MVGMSSLLLRSACVSEKMVLISRVVTLSAVVAADTLVVVLTTLGDSSMIRLPEEAAAGVRCASSMVASGPGVEKTRLTGRVGELPTMLGSIVDVSMTFKQKALIHRRTLEI